MGCLTSNRPFDFSAGPNHDRETVSFFQQISSLWDRGCCKDLVGSAALVEFCGLKILLVYLFFKVHNDNKELHMSYCLYYQTGVAYVKSSHTVEIRSELQRNGISGRIENGSTFSY